MIKKIGQGDGILIQQVHFASDNDSRNRHGIYISNSWGCCINAIINGIVEIVGCINTSINNSHFERGQIILRNSSVIINDSYLWKILDITPITIIDTEESGGFGHYNIPIFTELNNVIFELRYADYDYNNNTYDIDSSKSWADIKINNSYRRSEPKGAQIARMGFCGISIKTHNSEVLGRFNSYTIHQNYIISNEEVSHSSLYTNINSLLPSVSNNNTIKGNFEEKIYYYKVMILLDKDRMLRSSISNEKSIDKTSNNNYSTVLNIGSTFDLNCIYRIYRGEESNKYNKYVDIPNIKNSRIYDNGNTVNGFEWINRDNNVIDNNNYCEYLIYKTSFTNPLKIKCRLGNVPSYGNWLKEDEIINSNIRSGNTYNWICTESGTPGIWKAISTIQ